MCFGSFSKVLLSVTNVKTFPGQKTILKFTQKAKSFSFLGDRMVKETGDGDGDGDGEGDR